MQWPLRDNSAAVPLITRHEYRAALTPASVYQGRCGDDGRRRQEIVAEPHHEFHYC